MFIHNTLFIGNYQEKVKVKSQGAAIQRLKEFKLSATSASEVENSPYSSRSERKPLRQEIEIDVPGDAVCVALLIIIINIIMLVGSCADLWTLH